MEHVFEPFLILPLALPVVVGIVPPSTRIARVAGIAGIVGVAWVVTSGATIALSIVGIEADHSPRGGERHQDDLPFERAVAPAVFPFFGTIFGEASVVRASQ